MRKVLVFALLIIMALPVAAQGDRAAQTIQIEAADGLALIGDLYTPAVDGTAPAVVLLHMLGSNRAAYEPLIPFLLDAGYVVLNMDMRGHGETGGSRDWPLAEADVQTMFNWLREQEAVQDNAIAIIGASIGSNVALIGCANDDGCRTAVALSPGREYSGVAPGDAVTNGLAQRSALLVASHGDSFSTDTVIDFFAEANGNIVGRLYTGNAHGTALFRNELESVSSMIISWLDEQFGQQSAA